MGKGSLKLRSPNNVNIDSLLAIISEALSNIEPYAQLLTMPFCQECQNCLHKSFTDRKNPSVGYCEKTWSLAYTVLTSVVDFARWPEKKNISPHGKPDTFPVKSSKLKLKWKFCTNISSFYEIFPIVRGVAVGITLVCCREDQTVWSPGRL